MGYRDNRWDRQVTPYSPPLAFCHRAEEATYAELHQLEGNWPQGDMHRALGGSPGPTSWTPLLTNREELSFFTVLAFPKASRMGLACSSCRSNSP